MYRFHMKIQEPIKSILCETEPQQFKKGDVITNNSLMGAYIACMRRDYGNEYSFCGEILKSRSSFKMNRHTFNMLPTKLFKKDLPIVRFFVFRPETLTVTFDREAINNYRATFTVVAKAKSFACIKFRDFAKRSGLEKKVVDGNFLDSNIAKLTIIELVLDLLKKRLRKDFLLTTKEWRYTRDQKMMKKEIEQFLVDHFSKLGFEFEFKVGSLM